LAIVLAMHRSQRGWTGQARRRGGGRYFPVAMARIGMVLRIAVENVGRVGADARGQLSAMRVGASWRKLAGGDEVDAKCCVSFRGSSGCGGMDDAMGWVVLGSSWS
jgi:hypothetical protein